MDKSADLCSLKLGIGNGMDALTAAIKVAQNASLTQLNNSSNLCAVEKLADKPTVAGNSHLAAMAASYPNSVNLFPLAMYGQSPFIHPYLPPQLQAKAAARLSLPQGNASVPSLTPQAVDMQDIPCMACGKKCGNLSEFRDHIVKEHFSAGFNGDRQLSQSEPEHQSRKPSLPLLYKDTFENVNQLSRKKDSPPIPSNSQENKKSPSDFPIPTPNFALLTSYGKMPSFAPPVVTNSLQVKHDSTKLCPENFLPNPLAVGPNMKSVPIPALSCAYGVLNPFLAYQNMAAVNGMVRPSSASTSLPSRLPCGATIAAAAAAGYPFLRYPSSPGGFLPAPGRFPYFHGMPTTVPSSTTSGELSSRVDASTSQSESVDMLKLNKLLPASNKVKTLENAPPALDFQSAHADSIRRRLSVPLIGLNKEFRVPHPHTRISKSGNSNLAYHQSFMEQGDVAPGTLKHPSYSSTHRPNVQSSKKRMSVTERPLSNRVNAKSIEQHISKLISNNEKLLLNPALERVKPRRVFRRNSLDPASLSSYAAALAGHHMQDMSHCKNDDVIGRGKTFFEEGKNTSAVSGNKGSSVHFAHGLSSPDHDKLVQFSRAPSQTATRFQPIISVSRESNNPPSIIKKPHTQQLGQVEPREGLLGKRGSLPPQGMHPWYAKKPRRTSFFECNACGVRYRKEENFKIHKKMYCKFRDVSRHPGSNLRAGHGIGGFEEIKSRRHSDLPLPAAHLSRDLLKKYAHDDSSANLKLLPEKDSLPQSASTDDHDNQQKHAQEVLQPDALSDSPSKLIRCELSRAKSAEATLQSEPVNSENLKQDQVLDDVADDNRSLDPSQAASDLTNTSSGSSLQPPLAQTPTVQSSIPASKLPPNKRHLMRHFEQDVARAADYDLPDNAEQNKPSWAPNIPESGTNEISASSSNSGESISVEDNCGDKRVRYSILATSNLENGDEVLVPRSNYKQLLQKISLRNLQDIGLMGDSQANCGKPLPSWQELQRVFSNQNYDIRTTRRSSSVDTTSRDASENHRKFSVPSRLSQVAAENNNHHFPVSFCSSTSANRNTLAVSARVKDSVSPIASEMDFVDPGDSVSKPSPPNHSVSAVFEAAVPQERITGSKSECLAVAGRANRSGGTDKSNIPNVISTGNKRNDSSYVTQRSSDITSKPALNITTPSRKMDEVSSICYPHMRPRLATNCHSSSSYMLNPQPVCKMGSAASNYKASVFRNLDVPNPVFIPSHISVNDTLTGWRKSKDSCGNGIIMTVNSDSEVKVTEHAAYEKSKKEADRQNSEESLLKSRSRRDATPVSSSDDLEVVEKTSEDGANIPVQGPSILTKTSLNPIYTSCRRSQGALTSSPEIPMSRPTSGATRSSGSHSENGTFTCDRSSTNSSSKVPSIPEKDVLFVVQATNIRSHHYKSLTKPSSSRRSFEPKAKVARCEGSSGEHPTETDSDSIDTRIQFSGKVKRRRTRRERTESSPREKRRALRCPSPQSPTFELPVHQNKVCANVVEEKLRGCALCYMKVERADMVGDASTSCQPCKEAVKNKHLTVGRQNSKPQLNTPVPCSPLHPSPPQSTSAFLDKTRASSGTTQHWISSTTPELADHSSSQQPPVFRYPSPRSNKSSASDGSMDATIHSSSTALNPAEKVVEPDPGKGSGPATPELSPAVASPLLAEAVSEVMRSAAMQSKRQSKLAKRHQLLSNSRALVLGNLPSPLLSEQRENVQNKAPGNDNIAATIVNAVSPRSCLISCDPLHTPPVFTSASLSYHEKPIRLAAATSSSTKTAITHPRMCENTVSPVSSADANSSQQNETNKDVPNFNSKPPSIIEDATNLQPTLQSSSPTTEGTETNYRDELSCESDDEGVKEDAQAYDGISRPHKCDECKIAFRIGGHLAKHLKSKGHTLAMQKKWLNELKQRQMQLGSSGSLQLGTENAFVDVTCKENRVANSSTTSISSSRDKPTSSGLLDGTEVLAKSQVRALLEGSGEYACVPNLPCDDVVAGELADDLSGTQDPRPFKCIACKVAFRFQGHLDRHFRSNIHLIAVGHYEEDAILDTSLPAHTQMKISNDASAAARNIKGTAEEKTLSSSSGDEECSEKSNSGAKCLSKTPSELNERRDVINSAIYLYKKIKKEPVVTSPCRCNVGTSPRNGFVVPSWKISETQPESVSKFSPFSVENRGIGFDAGEAIRARDGIHDDCLSDSGDVSASTNHQAVTELRDHSNSQSTNSIPLRSTECLPRNVVMPCQVSCT